MSEEKSLELRMKSSRRTVSQDIKQSSITRKISWQTKKDQLADEVVPARNSTG
jgi:hypothetical protein